jgi:hypothetical protein
VILQNTIEKRKGVITLIKERISERIDTHLSVNYFCCNELRSGIITNLSAQDMYMKTNICFPCNSTFNVLIPSEKGILDIPVRICRIHKEANDYIGIGLTVVEQTEKYRNFLDSFKLSSIKYSTS